MLFELFVRMVRQNKGELSMVSTYESRRMQQEHESTLRAAVGGFHPGELHVVTLSASSGVTEIFSLADLVTAGHLTILPDPSEWVDSVTVRPALRRRLIEVLPHFEWQAFWKAFPDLSKIESIEPYS